MQITENGLDKPVLITDKDGLGLSVPASDFSISDVAAVVGGSHRVNVIDVASQLELGSWPLSDWAEYFENRTSAHKVLNLISLEITSTNLSQHVCGPRAGGFNLAAWSSTERSLVQEGDSGCRCALFFV